MTPNLIGLTGRAGTGKDTVAAALVETYGYQRVALADALRAAAYESNPLVNVSTTGNGYATDRLANLVDAHGWDFIKRTYSDVRRYLQHYGVAMRNALPGCWVSIAAQKIDDLITSGVPVVVTDVRFADEVDMVRQAGGFVARLNRKAATPLGVNADHVTERTDALDVDIDLDNDGPVADVPLLAASLHNLATLEMSYS